MVSSALSGLLQVRRVLALRRWRSLWRFSALLSLSFAFIVACTSNPTPEADAPADAAGETGSDRIAIGTTLTARTLDPADAYEIFPGILLHNLGDQLYAYEPGTTDLIPQLATELPTVSDDGLTYTIPLRDDVVFHDGTPFDAAAMVFSLDRFMQNAGRPAFLLADRIASVEATGDYEMTVTLNSPFAAFTALMTFWGVTPVPPDAYEIAEGSFVPDSFIGTGPYKLA
ncbi:MAG: ABC transporter substrate-binding protein, partial [Cyanobacteria bacterium P01_D01_bin.115]